MAIYKLDGICTSIRGNCSFQKKDIIDEGSDHSYVALHYGKTYKVSVVDNSFSYYVSNDFYKENQIVRKHDTVLVSTSETLDDLGHSYLYNRDDFGLLGGEQILLQANENIIIKKYLYYLSLGLKQQLKTYATGLKVYRFKKEDFRNINVVVPSIKEQLAIIDIIEPLEKLRTLADLLSKRLMLLGEKIFDLSSKRDVDVQSLDIKYGISVKPKDRGSGKFKLYGANGVIDKSIFSLNNNPCLIIGCRGNSVGSLHWSYKKAMILNTALYLEVNSLDMGNYYFALRSISGFKDRATGAAQPQITLTNIKDLKLKISTDVGELNAILKLIDNCNCLHFNIDRTIEALTHLLVK